MVFDAVRAEDMDDADAGRLEIVGDHGTVAPPPHCLRAHHRRPVPIRPAPEDGRCRRRRPGVFPIIGIAAE